MVVVLGSDSFLARAAITQIKDRYRAKHPDGVDLVEYDGEQPPLSWTDINALSLFTTTRLLIIRRAELLDATQRSALAAQLAHLPDTTIAVVWVASEKDLSDNDPLAVALQKAAKVISSTPLEPAAVRAWLVRRASVRGYSLTKELIDGLLQEHGNDLWALDTALVTASTAIGIAGATNKTKDDQPFIYFTLARRQDWPGITCQLQRDYQRGLPIELVLGSLGAAIRKLDAKTRNRRALTSLLADLDFGLKTGLLESASVYALLIGHLPKLDQDGVQWQKVWEETVS